MNLYQHLHTILNPACKWAFAAFNIIGFVIFIKGIAIIQIGVQLLLPDMFFQKSHFWLCCVYFIQFRMRNFISKISVRYSVSFEVIFIFIQILDYAPLMQIIHSIHSCIICTCNCLLLRLEHTVHVCMLL